MKFIAGIYNNRQLEILAPYVDGVVLMTPHYAYVYENLNLDEAISFCCANKIKYFISLTRIVMENELKKVEEFIGKYKDANFIVSDLGVVQLFIERNRINQVIYDPTTLVCNSMDLEIYSGLGFDAVGMSNEITIQDIITSYNKTNSSIFYQVFGRKMMYYSKRRLISTYKDYRNLSFETKHLYLREEKRDYDIPVYENENGTYCYRPYNISLINELENMSFLKYAYFETLNCSNDVLCKVFELYKKVINKEISLDMANNEIASLNIPIEDGFAYSDTVHVKEKIIQCKR